MSIKGKQLHGPSVKLINLDPYDITPESEKRRQMAVVKRYLSGPNTSERRRVLAEGIGAEQPAWHIALIDAELARRPTDPDLLAEGVLVWTGSNRRWIHAIWRELPKRQKFSDFMRGFCKADGSRFSEREIHETRKHGTVAELPRDIESAIRTYLK
jgi:hypothetical protein